jgi:Fasciclin domain
LIIPKAIKFNLRKHLIGMNATKFVSLLDEAGLGHYLEDSDNAYTILAPLNEALDLDEVPRKYLKNWLSYHILKGQWMPDNFTDGQLLKTESRSDELDGRKQRLKVYVESSHLNAKDHKSITFGRSGVATEPGMYCDPYSYRRNYKFYLASAYCPFFQPNLVTALFTYYQDL